MNLENLGWNQHFQGHYEQLNRSDLQPARVAVPHRDRFVLFSENGELDGILSGKLRHDLDLQGARPTVGDWVAVEPLPEPGRAVIHALLPRRTGFSRQAATAGTRTEEQVVAANVDRIFLVAGLDDDFNLRRMERYLTVAWDSGAAPVLVLNKADLCEQIDERIDEVETIACGVPVHAVSAVDSTGVNELREYLKPGVTVAFLGSSGVGKSTLINDLLGEERLKTGAVSDYMSKGHHTTTHRELIVLPQGGVVIDTPGMRELQLWSDEDGLKRSFEDVEELARQCRFTDCSHNSEPGCAVQQAIESGELPQERYTSYLKLQRELRYQATRRDVATRRAENRRFAKMVRQVIASKPKKR